MAYKDLIQQIHRSTPRDYLGERVIGVDKAACAVVAKRFDRDYWDGDRKYGYGGYRYDGRWRKLAEDLIREYGLTPGDRILDIGCGKGFLVYEFTQCLPGIEVAGLDISPYAIDQGKEEVRDRLTVGNAIRLPYADRSFDFVASINALHNLRNYELEQALQEIERVGTRSRAYLVIDSYRNDREKTNLLYWQLTCESFYTPEEWQWLFDRCGYKGDFGCIYYD